MAQSNDGFFSFMSYRAITYRNSPQWQMQQYATTDDAGLRRYNGLKMLAIGTGWGYTVGDVINVTLSSGIVITGIIGDIKADRHTCERNKRTAHNGCYLEFIVCIPNICPMARRMGDMSWMGFVGHVMSVDRITDE